MSSTNTASVTMANHAAARRKVLGPILLSTTLLTHGTSGIPSEVSQNESGAGAPYGRERLQHHAVVIQPAVVDGGHDHAEFAGHLISAQRHRKTIARLANQVEIRQGWFHHQHIRALF